MVVIGCYGAVLSILLLLFGMNSVLIICSVFNAVQRVSVGLLSSACIIYFIFCNKYFQLPLFSHGLFNVFTNKKVGKLKKR